METALLTSDFIHIGCHFSSHIYIDKKVKILFYAKSSSCEYNQEAVSVLNNIFNVKKIIFLEPNSNIREKIDVVFIGGEDPFELLSALQISHLHEKLTRLISKCTVFIGDDAGATLAGNLEPHQLFLENNRATESSSEKPKNKFSGFNLTNLYIQPHASKYFLKTIKGKHCNKVVRLPYPKVNGTTNYITYLNDHLKSRRLHLLSAQLKNNQVMIIKDNMSIVHDFDWSCYPLEK